MGKCCSKQDSQEPGKKQNKDIDDKRMFKVVLEFLNKEFCVETGYNRRAKKITQMLFLSILLLYRTYRTMKTQKKKTK